jgi:hypothetical protein
MDNSFSEGVEMLKKFITNFFNKFKIFQKEEGDEEGKGRGRKGEWVGEMEKWKMKKIKKEIEERKVKEEKRKRDEMKKWEEDREEKKRRRKTI